MAEFFPVRDQLLPEPIVARVVQPALKDRIMLAVYTTEIPVRLSARIPSLIERAPLSLIGAALFIRRLVVGGAVTEAIRRVSENVAFQRSADSRRGGVRCGDRLQGAR